MTIILGIDPGSRITGFGLIESNGNQHNYITSGCIRIVEKEFPLKLKKIFNEICKIIEIYKPQKSAIEDIFMHTNARSALKLGQARGAAITALVTNDIPVAEYSARTIKQSVVGYGAATKSQIQHMVKRLVNIDEEIPEDAADALAVALCHAHVGV